MTNLLQKILAIVLSLVVVLTTSGLNVYSHYCSCCHIFEVSITAFDENCCNEDDALFCAVETDDENSCCSGHDSEHENPHHTCSLEGCCKIGHDFLKIAENFNRSANVVVQVNVSETPADVFTQTYDSDYQQGETLHIVNNSSPPPLLVGKAYVVFTHSFKIFPSFIISA